MPLNTVDSNTLLQKMAATIQANVTKVLNLNPGSVLLSFLEAIRDVAMWLQSIVLQLLQSARLSTASGSDVDTFVADFGLTRLAAVPSTGTVTFSRNSSTQQAIIPAGSQVQTSDGTQTFIVIADTTQAAWNAGLDAYVIGIGVGSISASIQALNAGTQGNVQGGTITVLAQPIQGVQAVTNANSLTNGVDAESDTALKARFALFIASLRAGIKSAVIYAIASLQQGIQYDLTENQAYDGTNQNGFFYVVISPSTSAIQTLVYSAIDAIRPLTVTFGVFAATELAANISMTATAAAGYTHAQITADITTAIQDFIGTIGLGSTLQLTQLYAIAYGVAGVQEVTGMTINGVTADLSATAKQVITAGSVAVN